MICQSGAIVHYCAKLAGIFPSDIDEAAQADMILELCQDMHLANRLVSFYPAGTEEVWKGFHADYLAALPKYLAAIQKLLGESPFFGGYSQFHNSCNWINFFL
jgi:glutathione S-transferase